MTSRASVRPPQPVDEGEPVPAEGDLEGEVGLDVAQPVGGAAEAGHHHDLSGGPVGVRDFHDGPVAAAEVGQTSEPLVQRTSGVPVVQV
jgi:hypothetical protein